MIRISSQYLRTPSPLILALFSLSHLWRPRLCPAACKACVEGGLYITTDSGDRAMLRLNRADVEGQQAAGGGQGALQKMAAKHEEEVEAARALMRQMWNDPANGMTSSGDGTNPRGGVCHPTLPQDHRHGRPMHD